MMRISAPLLLTLCALISARLASGAQLSMTKNGPVHVFYVDGESLNSDFDTIYFQAKATTPGAFANTAFGTLGKPNRPPGSPFTYPNNMLFADPDDFPGGLWLTRLGLINDGQELSFTARNPSGTVTTAGQPNGDLFLANLYIPNPSSTFTATVQLISAGTVVFEAVQTVPEPASAIISLVAFGNLLAFRRRLA